MTCKRVKRLMVATVAAALVSGALALGWPAFLAAGTAQGFTPDDLRARALRRRAADAVVWGMPVVNFDRMYQAMVRDTHGKWNQVVYWSQPADWKNQTLTPNTDVLYVMPFINTRTTGPMVLEIPPADRGTIVGTVMDCWQVPLEDVGPAGADKGEGGRYLILPPQYGGRAPSGYIALPSDHYQGFALLRSIPISHEEGDIANAAAYAKRIRLYPLSTADKPPATAFIDAKDVVFDATMPYDMRFFESLNRMVQGEPWLERDRGLIDTLAAIGIEKGKPFKPDAKSRDILESAAQEAHAWLEDRYASAFPPYYSGRHWVVPVDAALGRAIASGFSDADSYPVDARAIIYTVAFSSVKHLGAGQFYLFTTRDKSGQPLDGAKTYRLVVPPSVPAKQYWSATAYDSATHALVRDVERGSVSSLVEGLQSHEDGSTELWFGPKAPEGRDSNWIPTRTDGGFEVIFRFYGPEQALFDKSWMLPDLAEVK